MPDYSKSSVYKIIDNTNGKIYIGSTTQTLSRRLDGHRGHYKHYLKGTGRYCKSFSILINNDYKIILLEKCNCENIDELHMIEQKYIDETDCINVQQAYQSKQNRKEYMKKLRMDNLEYRNKKDKEKYEYLKTWGNSYNNLLYINPFLFVEL
tara:strand:+ start:81 stop:536 length:456 start_codon:yes stop_codon:yes gene_type:complete